MVLFYNKYLVIFMILCSMVFGCTSVGHQLKYSPEPSNGWVESSDFLVDRAEFKCNNFIIRAIESMTNGQQYAIGCLIPFIPMPISLEPKDDKFNIDIIILQNEQHLELSKSNIVIKFMNSGQEISPIDYDKSSRSSSGFYIYSFKFDILRTEMDDFLLRFRDLENQCVVNELKYHKKDKLYVSPFGPPSY